MIGVQGQNSLENCAGNPVMDTALSSTSTDGLQNRVIYNELTTRDNNIPWFGYCQTAASTKTKSAYTNSGKFSLVSGAKVKIKFSYNNTHATPTLNVDSTGEVAIKAYGTTAPTLWWLAGDVVEFTYDGTNYIMGATEGQIQSLNSDINIAISTDRSNILSGASSYINTSNSKLYDLKIGKIHILSFSLNVKAGSNTSGYKVFGKLPYTLKANSSFAISSWINRSSFMGAISTSGDISIAGNSAYGDELEHRGVAVVYEN